jgi:hypothetical protein
MLTPREATLPTCKPLSSVPSTQASSAGPAQSTHTNGACGASGFRVPLFPWRHMAMLSCLHQNHNVQQVACATWDGHVGALLGPDCMALSLQIPVGFICDICLLLIAPLTPLVWVFPMLCKDTAT